MSTQRIVWTALPSGYDETARYLKLSVFVSPRLTPGAPDAQTLAAFPDFHAWPTAAIDFAIEFNTPGGVRTLAAERDPDSPTPDKDLWTALFPLTTPVRGYTYKPLDGFPIRSYHALGLHEYLKDIYQTAATAHATDYPPVSDLGEWLTHLRYDDKRDANLKQQVLNEPFPPAGEPFSAHKDFLRFQVFHTPFSKKQVPIQLPEMDFHDIVGALARYPGLLRQLGLVVDIRMRRGDLSLPLDSTVRVVPRWQPETATEDVKPWTHYTFGSGRIFQAAPGPGGLPEYVDLKLPLGDTQRYGVIQLDVDGLSFKALHLAGNLVKLAQTPFAQPLSNYWLAKNQQQAPENTASLSSGSSTGLSVVKNYRAAGLYNLLAANTLHNAAVDGGTGDSMELWLEDLVRGHRLDVLDEAAGQWYSLHERVGTYTIDGAPVAVARPEDEGWAMTALTSPADPAAPKELRLHEAIAEWSGWSLSAPRPESVIGTHDEIAGGPGKPSAANFRLQTTFTPPLGKLPRLRFGRRYRLKVRSADLAGNGPALVEQGLNPQTVSPQILYRRYEPVPQPVLLPRAKYKESESVEHLVVRTWTTPPADTPTTEIAERHVAPPVTTVRTAELHGRLDDPAGPGGFRADAYTLLTGLEGTAPTDPVPDSRWRLNYLADPMARGAAFSGLPGTGTVHTFPFDTDPWPKYRPFRLKVVSGTGAPGVDGSDPDALTVQLPPAEVARVRMSCYPDQGELEGQSGIWRWVMESFNPGDPETPPSGNPSYDQKLNQALAGQHWMVTPYREILLIHAVQQPLVPPHFNTMGVSRAPGVTWADIRYFTPLDGKSTQKFDVDGKWTQWIDPLGKAGPEQVDGEAHAFTTPVDPEISGLEALGRHEFGDTKHRHVHYDGTALTRFPEFFPPGTTPLTHTAQETAGDRWIHIPSSARPAVPDVLYILPAFEWVPGQSGSTSTMTRKGNALRIYLNRPWYSSGDDEKLGIVLNLRPQTGVWAVDFAREVRGKYESQWGEDPAITSAATGPALQPGNFELKVETPDMLTLDEVGGGVCTVAAHEVKYDATQKLWYCDVRINPAAGFPAYMPFVRMALVRYQPYSIPNAHLSRVAQADFAQLTADRTVSVTPGAKAGEYNVSLFGIHAHVSQTGASGPWRRAEVQLERQNQAGSDFGWAPVGQPVPLTVFFNPNLYSGTVKIPAGQDPARYRLVFKEYEKLLADQDDRSPAFDTFKEVWRLVFAHAMPFGPIM
jgi:hypothetical protein